MKTILIILTVIVAILLIIVVLVQKSKGGGLASNFSGSNQIMGVRRTNDFIEKATWTLACVIAVLAIASAFFTQPINPNASRVKVQQAAVVEGTEYSTEPVAAPEAEAVEVVAEEAAAAADSVN